MSEIKKDKIFDGPYFKPENHHLIHEGWPLGTRCWYVIVRTAGLRKLVCSPTKLGAIKAAAEYIVERFSNDKKWVENELNWIDIDLPPDPTEKEWIGCDFGYIKRET